MSVGKIEFHYNAINDPNHGEKEEMMYTLSFQDDGTLINKLNNFQEASFVGDFEIKCLKNGTLKESQLRYKVLRNIKITIEAGENQINNTLKSLAVKYDNFQEKRIK